MLGLFKNADVVTLRGTQIDRVQQALDVARHQVELGQLEADDYRLEDALVEAEGALARARAAVANAKHGSHSTPPERGV
jgi:septal ring factor EnvC (AmiA/AmiB activator)